MLVSVSGWSGPSFAFRSSSVVLEQRQGPVELAGGW